MSFAIMVAGLKDTTTRWEKEYFLQKYYSPFIQFLLQETFDPALLHNVRLQKKSIPEPGVFDLEDCEEQIGHLFNFLHHNQSSKENKERVIEVMEQLNEEAQELFFAVVNKKLKAGVSIKTLNKVWPGLIQADPIQLANKYSPTKKYPVEYWYESDKLDGVRLFCFRLDDGWHIYSRSKDYIGRELFTLDHWKYDLDSFYVQTGYTYIECEGYKYGWDFSRIQSAVFSTVNLSPDAPAIVCNAFLIGRCNGEIRCEENLSHVVYAVAAIFEDLSTLSAVKQSPVANRPEAIMAAMEKAKLKGFEGIMLRSPEVLHSPKRDDNLLKVKPEYFDGLKEVWDCEVLAVEFDDFVVQEDGVMTSEYLPVRLIVLQPDGVDCKVGSGFSLPWRRAVKEDPDIVMGKTVEIEHYGIGSKGRMRFPVLHKVREDV